MVREIITRSLMVMSLPGRVLVARRSTWTSRSPRLLRDLSDAELTALFARFDPRGPVAGDGGARDWSDFDQRMHYIAHLFRAFHLHEELLGPPFTAAQVARSPRARSPTARCRGAGGLEARREAPA